jgi:hypothetical protein
MIRSVNKKGVFDAPAYFFKIDVHFKFDGQRARGRAGIDISRVDYSCSITKVL